MRPQPAYGFQGATGALAQGQIIHYDINLHTCKQISVSLDKPEFVELFGGYVDHYKTINEKQPEPRTNLMFYQQNLVLSSSGKLVQLSREITIWLNNTVTVASHVYTAGFGVLLSMYEHKCTMESENQTLGDVRLQAIGSPSHLFKFEDIAQTLQQRGAVTFSAMSFLCAGEREYSYSNIGGQIYSYDMPIANASTSLLRIDVPFRPTVHYNSSSSTPEMNVLRMCVFDNRTIQFINSRGIPPNMDHTEEHEFSCILETSMPGGTVNYFSV